MKLLSPGLMIATALGIASATVGVALASPEVPTQEATPVTVENRSNELRAGECSTERGDWCTRISLAWPEVVNAPGDTAADSINQYTQAWLLRPIYEARPATAEELLEEFQSSYDELRREFPDYQFPWWVERTATVSTNLPPVFSMTLYEDAFTGGAHGMHNLTYANFDPSTGARLTLDDVLVEGAEPALTRIAERLFRLEREIEEDVSLDDAGFWFDDGVFALNDNFLISTEGLTFYFNEYEITAYAYGPTRLLLPGSLIRDLLQPRFR